MKHYIIMRHSEDPNTITPVAVRDNADAAEGEISRLCIIKASEYQHRRRAAYESGTAFGPCKPYTDFRHLYSILEVVEQ